MTPPGRRAVALVALGLLARAAAITVDPCTPLEPIRRARGMGIASGPNIRLRKGPRRRARAARRA